MTQLIDPTAGNHQSEWGIGFDEGSRAQLMQLRQWLIEQMAITNNYISPMSIKHEIEARLARLHG